MNLRGFSLSRSFVLILVAGLVPLLFGTSLLSGAAVFRGVVTNELSGLPVKEVQLEVRDSSDDSLLARTVSDPVGHFTVRPLEENRDVILRAIHPAYQEKELEIASADLNGFQTIELTPRADFPPGVEFFDITVQVVCAVSGHPVDRAPITLRRYEEATGGGATAVRTQVTGKSGATVFTGLLPGYYTFEINAAASPVRRPFYEEYPASGDPTQDRVLIEKEHFTNVFLKPVEQAFGVLVWGNDPVFTDTMRENYLAEMIVEVTGVSPDDPNFLLLPARNDISRRGPPGPDGTYTPDPVLFTGLPPIAYRVRVARLGYWEQFVLVQPDEDGRLPYSADNPLVVQVQQQNNSLRVNVSIPGVREYNCDDGFMVIYPGPPYSFIELSGIDGTNTEGIVRRKVLTDAYCGIFDTVEWLLPGTYRFRVDGDIPFRYFTETGNFIYYGTIRSGVTTVEVLPALTRPLIGAGGRQTAVLVDAELSLPRVRGALWAAETVRERDGEPVYQPFGGQRLIFREHSVRRRDDDLFETEVVTAPDGSFDVVLEPGVYGVLAPDLDGFHGYETMSTIIDSPRYPAGQKLTGPWPLVEPLPDVYDSSQAFAVAELGFGESGMVVHGDEEIRLDLFLRKEAYSFTVTGTANGYLDTRYLAGGTTIPNQPLLNANAEVTATGSDGLVRAPLLPNLQGNGLVARFQSLPGAISGVAIDDDRYDFQYFEQSFRTVNFPVPGMPPPVDRAFEFVPQGGARLLIPLDEVLLATFTGWGKAREEAVLHAEVWSAYWQDWTRFEVYSTFYSVPGEDGFYPGRGPAGSTGYVKQYGYWFAMKDGDVIQFDENGIPISPYLSEAEVPEPSYNFSVIARPRDDLANEAHGVPLVHTPTGSKKSTPEALWHNLTTAPEIALEAGSNYLLLRTGEPRLIAGGPTPTLEMEVVVSRGVEIDITLIDSVYDVPIPGGWVSIHSRYGSEIARLQTDENGRAVFNAVGSVADYFASASLPGYAPMRLPLRMEDALDGTDGSTAARFQAALRLRPLERPMIVTTGNPINRYGPFLPSVNRSGTSSPINQDYSPFSASDVLTAHWTIEVKAAEIGYHLSGFDTPNGEPGETVEIFELDPVEMVYLVDQRLFPKSGFGGDRNAVEPIVLPTVDDPAGMNAFLESLTRYDPDGGDDVNLAARQRLFIQKMDTLEADPANPGHYIAKGSFKLWDLPPGDFEPAFIVVSKRGAVDFLKVAYTGAAAEQQLTGLSLPSWLGGVLDILGVISGVNASQETLKKYVPDGRFIPFPEFTAKIALDPAGSSGGGYINYEYAFSVGQAIGQETSAGGILGLGPGMIGAKVKSTATLIAIGRDRSFSMTINGSVMKQNFINDPLPPKLSKPNFIKLEIPKGVAEVATSLNIGIDEAAPFDFRLQTSVGGGLEMKTTTALNNYARPIPYVGPVIGLLGDADLARLDLEMRGSGTFSETFTWETRNPHKILGSTRPAGERVARRHFLGGMEGLIEPIAPGVPTLEFCASIGFGSSLILNLVDGLATAKASFDIGGTPCIGVGGFSGVTITTNPLGTWPLIKRVQGKATVSADLEYKMGIVKPAVSWKFDLIDFDVQYGTETTVQHIPVTVTYHNGGYNSLQRGQFNGGAPAVISQFPSGGGAFAPVKETNAITYVLYDPTTGDHQLFLADATGALKWGNSEPIVVADHIVAATGLGLDDGRFLLVWAEPVAGADLNDPLLETQLRFRLREPDGTLSAISELAALRSIPRFLELTRSGNLIGLLVVEQFASDAATSGYQISATVRHFQDPGFSDPVQMFLENQVQGAGLLGGGPGGADELLLLWVDSSAILRAKSYRAVTGPSPLRTILTQATGAFAGVATASGYEILASTNGGGLNRYIGNMPFTFASLAGRNERIGGAASAALAPQTVDGESGWLGVWTEPSPQGTEIRFLRYSGQRAFADQEPEMLTRNPRGFYDNLKLIPESDTEATLFAFYQNGPVGEWRTFAIDSESGRDANDSNQNGISDLDELRLVDADPTDAIRSVSDAVLNNDFDGDGFSDRDEILAGSDPLDSTDTPTTFDLPIVQMEVLQPHLTEAGKPGSFQVTRTGNLDTSFEVSALFSGDAVKDVDYEIAPPAIHFQSGATLLQFVLTAIPDEHPEEPETIEVSLAEPGPGASYALGPVSSGRFLLTDNRLDDWVFAAYPEWTGEGIADWEDDRDGDGVPLLVEYFAGNDPRGMSASPVAISTYPKPDGATIVRIQVTVDPQATDVQWQMEQATDLAGPWISAAPLSEIDRTALDDGRDLVVLEAEADAMDSMRFYRLRIIPANRLP